MKKLTSRSVIFMFLASVFIGFNHANAETLDRYAGSSSVATTELDGFLIESVISNKKILSKKIYIGENINDITIEHENTGIIGCIGVSSCNDMIAYCVGTLDSDPACIHNDEGQPVGCVC